MSNISELKKERFNLDQEILKPYFKLENVIDGVFTVASKLYGLQFNETKEIEKYHPDVKTYNVTDENGNDVEFDADDFDENQKEYVNPLLLEDE